LKTALSHAPEDKKPAIRQMLDTVGRSSPAAPLAADAAAEAPARAATIFEGVEQFNKIIFLNDSSASMINEMAGLKAELLKVVNRLKPEQSFNVIFYKDQTSKSVGNELLLASPEAKKDAAAFLDRVAASGVADPLAGLAEAFRQKPQVIYLGTAGDFRDNQAVLMKIRELNKDHTVRVNTIAFVSGSESGATFVDFLQKIAQENGGKYRLVKE
jgi:hypothetical protein